MPPAGSRPRRVLLAGAAGLALTLAALSLAAWALGRADDARRLRDVQAQAARVVERVVQVVGRDPAAAWTPLDAAFRPLEPPLPRAFASDPPVADTEAAFYVDLAARDDALRETALSLAAHSDDARVRLLAALARARGGGAVPEGAAELPDTRDGVLLGLLRGDAAARERALRAVGTPDEDVAAALLVGTAGPAFDAPAALRERRDALRTAGELASAAAAAPPTDDGARVLVEAGGALLVALPQPPRDAAAPPGAAWWVTRRGGGAFEAALDGLTLPALVVAPAGARPAPDVVAVTLPGSGGYRVADDPPRGVTAALPAVGFVVTALAALVAFAAFARGVLQEARLARLRHEFVTTVGHELRTPVAVIRTAAEALELGRATSDADRARLTAAVLRESERLSALLGNVLDFARMESGRGLAAPAPHDVVAVVQRCVAAHGPALARSAVRVDVVAPATLVADCIPDALGAALGNLLDNAAKYAGGDVAVHVRADGADVELAVVDRGPGVPDAEKRLVFERFVRGASDAARTTRGTGIGLALVAHAAAAHGGRADVVDTPGGGATFRIRWPRGGR